MYDTGKLDEALELILESLRISRSIHNLWGEAAALFSIGPLYIERGEFDEAVKALEEAIPKAVEVNFAGPPLIVKTITAFAFGNLGDPKRGLEYLREAHAEDSEREQARQFALSAIAYFHVQLGDIRVAETALKEAFGDAVSALTSGTAAFFGIMSIFPTIAYAATLLGKEEHERLLTLTDRTIDSMNSKGMKVFLPDVLRLRGEALLGLGRNSEAHEVLTQARREAEAQGSRRSAWPILSILAQLEEERGNEQEASSLRSRAREIIEFIAEHAGSPELRASLMAMPQVVDLLSKT